MKTENFRTPFPHSGGFSGVRTLQKHECRECLNLLIGVHFGASWAHLGSNQGPSDYESDALTG